MRGARAPAACPPCPACPPPPKHPCDVGGQWYHNANPVSMATDVANVCAGSHVGNPPAWTYTVSVMASCAHAQTGAPVSPCTQVTLSDGTLGTVEGVAPARSIAWNNQFTYTER